MRSILSLKTLSLWRRLLKESKNCTIAPVRRKIQHNIKKAFYLHKLERKTDKIQKLHLQAESALRLLVWINSTPQVPHHLYFFSRYFKITYS